MGKVKVTREQAIAIEDFLLHNVSGKRGMLNGHARHYGIREVATKSWGYPFESLNDLLMSELADALYIGYEVEETFDVGDWVTTPLSKVLLVKSLNTNSPNVTIVKLDNETVWGISLLRHATPEEIATEKTRRWWEFHGRREGSLKEFDLIKGNTTNQIYEVLTQHNGATEMYRLPDRKSYRTCIMNTTRNYRVICFAHNRLDKPNE